MVEDKVYVVCFIKESEWQYRFQLSLYENKNRIPSPEEKAIVQEFLDKSTGVEDNFQRLKDGGVLDVVLTKKGGLAEYRIKCI